MEKKRTFITIAVTVLVLTIGVTFAYFMARTGAGASANANITADTVDDLKFSVSKENLSLNINQFNFASGAGNISDSITATASLKANSTKKTATSNYYVYFIIEKNEYIYTTYKQSTVIPLSIAIPNELQDEIKPEVVLTITGPNGEITSLGNLSYVTATNADGTVVKGFDITTIKPSALIITDNQEISSTSSTNYTKQDWTFTVTFINLDTNQADNEGKTLTGKVIIQKEKIPEVVSDVCKDGDNLSTCIIMLENNSTSLLTNIYHHDGKLENGINDGSYRYSGSNYKLTTKAFDAGYHLIESPSSTSNIGIIEFYCNGTKTYYGASCSSSSSYYYKLSYDDSDTQYSSYNSAIQQAIKDEYIEYNVRNYICFGSKAETCPEDNLYRIIGVIDGKVKLIKYDYATNNLLGTNGDDYSSKEPNLDYKGNLTTINIYSWNYKNDTTIKYGSNTWSTSLLNKINLNTNFINNIGEEWADKITTTTWKVGGNTVSNLRTVIPSVTYQNEIINPEPAKTTDNATEYKAKIGLMYISDYGFASAPNSWTKTLYYYGSRETSANWIHMREYEWTLTRNSESSDRTFEVSRDGTSIDSYVSFRYAVRPVFSLFPSITYKSGSGTSTDPIRISL